MLWIAAWMAVFFPIAVIFVLLALFFSDLLMSYPPSVQWITSIPSWAVADGPLTALRRAGRTTLSGVLARWHWFRTPIADADSPPTAAPSSFTAPRRRRTEPSEPR